MKIQEFDVSKISDMTAVARKFSSQLNGGDVVCIDGDLGAGKTFFTQQAIKALGHEGIVTSPTFSIVETYSISGQLKSSDTPIEFNHFDLYRIEDPQELENIGFRDYFHSHAINFIEWSSKAGDMLPKYVHNIVISFSENNCRKMSISSIYSVSI